VRACAQGIKVFESTTPGQGDGPEHSGAALSPTRIFEPIWNANFHLQACRSRVKTVRVEERAAYYESSGACATWSRPLPDAWRSPDGSARPFRPRSDPQRKRPGGLRRPAAWPTTAEPWKCCVRGQYRAPAAQPPANPFRPTATERALEPEQHHETYVGDEAVHRQLALGKACPLSGARANACPKRALRGGATLREAPVPLRCRPAAANGHQLDPAASPMKGAGLFLM